MTYSMTRGPNASSWTTMTTSSSLIWTSQSQETPMMLTEQVRDPIQMFATLSRATHAQNLAMPM